MEQMRHMLDCIIHTYVEADNNEIISAAKVDVKDCFWQCVVEEGEEWNFAYVLSQVEGEPVKLVFSTFL